MIIIKTFERFKEKNISEIRLDCEDILLELKDQGFTIRVFSNINNDDDDCVIVKIINYKPFSDENVKEYTDRLTDYLGQKSLIPNPFGVLREEDRTIDGTGVNFWEMEIFFAKKK